MKLSESENVLRVAFLFMILIGSMASVSSSSQPSSVISSLGSVRALPQIQVTVDFSKVIAVNNLSLGVHILYEWPYLANETAYTSLKLQEKFLKAGFKIVRFFVHEVNPYIYWNETTQSGKYDWTRFDRLMSFLQGTGVKVLLVIGFGGYDEPAKLPSGMDTNYNNTGFPKPESFAALSRDIASHVKEKGWQVDYWEPWNEPRQALYGGEIKYKAFVNLFNSVTDNILQIFPSALFGVDFSNIKSFIDRFTYDSRNVGFLSFHKYDSWSLDGNGHLSDDDLLKAASILGANWSYTPEEMREKWFRVHGKRLPIICSETNLNSAWVNGTDPRVKEVVGGVWYAEQIRAFILSGIDYSVYFHFSTDNPYWGKTRPVGYGLGMLNMTPPHEEWYPYWVSYLIGNNLETGDKIFDTSTSNFSAVSILAWEHENYFVILFIGKISRAITVHMKVLNVSIKDGTMISAFIIDRNSMRLRTENMSYSNPISIRLDGYSAVLLKIPVES